MAAPRGHKPRGLPLVTRHARMPMKKTIREALIIVLITMLLALAHGVLSPAGRILLKKGLHLKIGSASNAGRPAGGRAV